MSVGGLHFARPIASEAITLGMAPFRRTGVVEGPLAFQMRRLAAARANDSGLQIFNLPQVAARLAGGFLYPVTPDFLNLRSGSPRNKAALPNLILSTTWAITRAVARTLRHAWNADIDLSEIARRDGAARLSDLAIIEQRVRANSVRGHAAARHP